MRTQLNELLNEGMDYEEILDTLDEQTDNFTLPEGEVAFDDKYEAEIAISILKNHYENVDDAGLGILNEADESAFVIKFSSPYVDDFDFPDEEVEESLNESLNESNTSRIYNHLSDDSNCAIISAYRGEYPVKENKEHHKELKSDVRKMGLGFIEFTSRWVEDGESFDEESLLIPNIDFDKAIKLGKKYEQASVIYKDKDRCVEICTTPFETYTPGDVVRTYNNVGPNMLNLSAANEIFERRKDGPASMPKNGGKAFNLQVVEKLEARPSYFKGPEEKIIYESKNDSLNPALWDGDELKPEVKEKLEQIADVFIKKLEEDDIPLDIDDVVIVGSNANYNYGPQSDIDLHLIADLSQFKGREVELAKKIYQCKKSLFNDKYDPMINGFEVEIYVEPAEDKDKDEIPDEVEDDI